MRNFLPLRLSYVGRNQDQGLEDTSHEKSVQVLRVPRILDIWRDLRIYYDHTLGDSRQRVRLIIH